MDVEVEMYPPGDPDMYVIFVKISRTFQQTLAPISLKAGLLVLVLEQVLDEKLRPA